MVVYSNKIFKTKSPLSAFIPEYRVVPRKIIQLLKKKFQQLYYALKHFKMFLTKNFFFRLIAKMQKKFFKKMFKILFQNKSLLDGKRSCQFFILKLNLLKVIQTLFLIFYHVSFYMENEISKAQSQIKNLKSLLCNASSQTRKTQYSNPKQILSSQNYSFKPAQINICSNDLFKSKPTRYV